MTNEHTDNPTKRTVPDFRSLQQDPVRRKQGAWVRHATGISVRVRAPDDAFYEEVRRDGAPFRAQYRETGEMDDEAVARVARRAAARHLITDWKDIQIDGQDVPFSEDKAFEFFSDPRYEWFYVWVVESANSEELYRTGELEADAGN